MDARQAARPGGASISCIFGRSVAAISVIAWPERPMRPGAADAVDEQLARLRQVVVDHAVDVQHVEAAGRDVGREQDRQVAVAEALDDAVARRLAQVALQRLDLVAQALQAARQVDHAVAGAAEDEGCAFGGLVEQAEEDGQLVAAPDLDDAVLDVGRCFALVADRDDDSARSGSFAETSCTQSGVVAEKRAVWRERWRRGG